MEEKLTAVNPMEELLKKAAIAGLLAFLTTLVSGLTEVTK